MAPSNGFGRWCVQAITAVATAAMLVACGASSTPVAPSALVSPPGASQLAQPPALTEAFTSALYGYSVRYPATFSPRSATAYLQGAALPLIDGDEVDQLTNTSGEVIVLAAGDVRDDMTVDAWTAATARGFCGTPSTSERTTLGGEPANLDTFATCAGMFHQWATAVHGRRGYHVVWANGRGTEAADRALFLDILETFEFGDAQPSPAGSPAATAAMAGLRPIEPGDVIPDELLGPWYHASGAFLWILRAGDPVCLKLPRTSQDCAIWQPTRGKRLETGILTVVDGELVIQWTQGGCAGTSYYSFGSPTTRLALRLVRGCNSGDFVLLRPGTDGAPVAPPKPGS